ncbi:hypothetical protein E2C01_081138 [Portunus trituberculatus]|uniref:Uncharacterized protein n=1 Tax=Portunus trituberculatus TaxID=210409 RepID=A0A5B7IV04_PORTR|nr:hypothetical protein [Portunus trituberculatus]
MCRRICWWLQLPSRFLRAAFVTVPSLAYRLLARVHWPVKKVLSL